MRTYSGPMSRVSSGTLPGHSSTTIGLSAPTAGQAMHNHGIREMAAAIRFMVAPSPRSPAEHAAGPEQGFLHGQVVLHAEVGCFLAGDHSGELAQVGELQGRRLQIDPLPVRCPRPIDLDRLDL